MSPKYSETMSKLRTGFNSETQVKRGMRIVHGEKELVEKLGRNGLCPCGSGRKFQGLLHHIEPVSLIGPTTNADIQGMP